MNVFEQISLDQCLSVLKAHDIYFVIPRKLEKSFQRKQEVLKSEVRYKTFDNHFFADIPGYNYLMKSDGFYKRFLEYDFMLIHQLDAFVFRDDLNYWCAQGYDFIGAPLFEGHDNAEMSSTLVGQGNGGFSLRNIRTCYKIVSQFKRLNFIRKFDYFAPNAMIRAFRYLKHQIIYNFSGYPLQPIINEDLFWAEVIPQNFPEFTVPDPLTAMKFSFEVNAGILYQMNNNELPFGCHAWWKYDLPFWKDHIQKLGYNI
ncbi:DUF5672 family protein [Pedobacter sp. Leaf250]|uniref:DUF5672 family protein n=1 Tax=Pedobacter sp. Leaf250 TaxID=2876559 RepID=UPI001E2C097B|nr:DUF5672 family protein [Pedobacter sp. Leaf250]